MHQTDINTLRTLAQTLIDKQASPGDKRDAANGLFDGMSAIIGFDDEAPEEQALLETWVDGGWAISMREAARCLREYQRSAQFMSGVHAAIHELRARFPDETIHVLYAGCGPFAPLVLPLAHRWAADEVRYTLLDIHEYSLASARKIAQHLGLEDCIEAFVAGNAIEYQSDPAHAPHLLVTETMARSLQDETQVAICRQLVPQIRPNGILVPERIELLATLMPRDIQSEDATIELGRVMVLDKDNAAQGGACANIDWPQDRPQHLEAKLRTRIQVYGDYLLEDYACSLNLPVPLPMPEAQNLSGERLGFRYAMQPKPHLASDWQGKTWETPASATDTPKPQQSDSVGSLRLPLDFDAPALLQELHKLDHAPWVKHPNSKDYAGQWTSLALRSPSGQEDDQNVHCEHADDYQDTPALNQSPALRAVLAALPGKVGSARLLSLAAGSKILEHHDPGTDLWSGLVRLHVPIATHADAHFRIDGTPVPMAAGECWYINANHPHAAHNASDQDRVHLIADCEVTEALIQQFLAWGHPPQRNDRFKDPNLNLDNVDQVIASLREAKQDGLADKLQAEADHIRAQSAA